MNLKMKYRPFGLTGLQMPVLTCGGMRYHYKWQDLRPDEVPHAAQENLAKTLHRRPLRGPGAHGIRLEGPP